MLFQHRFEEKGIHLRYDVQRDVESADSPRTGDTESSFVVQGHRDLLAQALYNLFENAWRYTSTGGSVDMLLARRAGDTEPVVVLEMTNRSPDLAKLIRPVCLIDFTAVSAADPAPPAASALATPL